MFLKFRHLIFEIPLLNCSDDLRVDRAGGAADGMALEGERGGVQ